MNTGSLRSRRRRGDGDRIEDDDAGEAGEIADVEGEDARDPEKLHRGDIAGVVGDLALVSGQEAQIRNESYRDFESVEWSGSQEDGSRLEHQLIQMKHRPVTQYDPPRLRT